MFDNSNLLNSFKYKLNSFLSASSCLQRRQKNVLTNMLQRMLNYNVTDTALILSTCNISLFMYIPFHFLEIVNLVLF